MTAPSRQAAWQAQSLLLGYPADDLVSRVPILYQAAAALDEPIGGPLCGFLHHVARTPLPELVADDLATFDYRKRCCLYLVGLRPGP
jgi:nitrate reductase delta subunit